ncbi:hypothetical protein PP651_gp05 [Aeromonas phage ZPAH14]|uniref:Lipoprotein n=1 Tax=Aeromonas phage ZPAH14 TaxID=2924887 RepID=A0AAE9KJR0_9CAUD|nr:hypothetical protein PP651_gp05 [Aeromonas phage ZPAH14]UOT57997.1 hypothetical protein [Aeromonas phage ZPAH14]
MRKLIAAVAAIWLAGCTIIEHSEHTTVSSDASIQGITINMGE